MALVADHVPEPLVAAAVFVCERQAAPYPPRPTGRADSLRSAPLFPKQSLVAVSATTTYLFEARGGFGWHVRREFGRFPHGCYQACPRDGVGGLTRALRLEFFDGSWADLETHVAGARTWQAAAVDALVALSGAPLR